MDENNGRGLFGSVAAWLAHPFNSNGSAITWVLWVGLLVIAVFLWDLVLHTTLEEI